MNLLVYVLWLHFLADFCLQTRWQGRNKSSNNWALASHITSYSVLLALGLVPVLGLDALWFVAANAAAHLLTDAISSRWTKRLYAEGKEHAFFVVIGADQFAHTAVLAWLLPMRSDLSWVDLLVCLSWGAGLTLLMYVQYSLVPQFRRWFGGE